MKRKIYEKCLIVTFIVMGVIVSGVQSKHRSRALRKKEKYEKKYKVTL